MSNCSYINALSNKELDNLKDEFVSVRRIELIERKAYETGELNDTAIKALNIMGRQLCSLIEKYDCGFYDREIATSDVKRSQYDLIIHCYSESISVTYLDKRIMNIYYDENRESVIYKHVVLKDVIHLCCRWEELYLKIFNQIKYLYTSEIKRIQEARETIRKRIQNDTKILSDFIA